MKPRGILLTEARGLTIKQVSKEIKITASSAAATKAVLWAFPDFEEESDGVYYLEFESFKDDDDHWTGYIQPPRGRDRYARVAGVEISMWGNFSRGTKVRVSTSNRPGGEAWSDRPKSEEHVYPGLGFRPRVRPLILRAFKTWMNGLLDGTNGKDREFTKKERKRRGRGSPAQLKAIEKVRAIVDDERFDFKEFKPDKPRKESDTQAVYTLHAKHFLERTGGLIWIRTGGAMSLDMRFGSKDHKKKGREAWRFLEMAAGIREPTQEEDFAALMVIVREKGTSTPEKDAARDKAEVEFKTAGWGKRDDYIMHLRKILRDAGVKVKRNKRKQLVAEARRPRSGSDYSDMRDKPNDSRNRHPLSWKKLRAKYRDRQGIPSEWYDDDEETWYINRAGGGAGPYSSKGHAAEGLFRAQRDHDRWARAGSDLADPDHYDTWEPNPRAYITIVPPYRIGR